MRVIVNVTQTGSDELPRLSTDPALVLGAGAARNDVVFGSIPSAVILSDGRIVVADAHDATIRVFDMSGQQLVQAGGEGSGPGEFRSISALHRLAGDTLLVEDSRSRRLTRFSPDLDPLEAHTLYLPRPVSSEPGSAGRVILRVVGAFPDGTLLATSRGNAQAGPRATTVYRDSLALWRFDPRSTSADSIGLVLGTERFIFFGEDGAITFGDLPVGHGEPLAVAADRYYYGSGNAFEVGEYTPEGRLRRVIRVCEDPDPIDPGHVERVVDRQLDLVPAAERGFEERALHGIPWPEVAPSFLRLMIDASGRLWARDFTYPGEPQRWKLFTSEGRWLGDVDMPPGVDPLGVGSEYLLGRHTDGSGVEMCDCTPSSPRAPATSDDDPR